MKIGALGIGALAFEVVACVTQQEGQLYRQDAPGVSRIHVANASAESTEVFAELSDGTTCNGRIARTDSADSSFAPESEISATSDGAIGVLVCRSKAVLRCRLVHRMATSYAYGECVDQHGAKYTVVF
jgi:hypothetical protein